MSYQNVRLPKGRAASLPNGNFQTSAPRPRFGCKNLPHEIESGEAGLRSIVVQAPRLVVPHGKVLFGANSISLRLTGAVEVILLTTNGILNWVFNCCRGLVATISRPQRCILVQWRRWRSHTSLEL